MEKIMDFCGSGKMLDVLLSDDCFRSQLCEETQGRKVTMVIFAEDKQECPPLVSGDQVSYNDLTGWNYVTFGNIEGAEIKPYAKETLQGNDLSVQVEDDLRYGEFDESRIDVIGQNGNDGEHYKPKFGPSADGWIAWRGGVKPVASEQLVSTKWSNGDTYVSEAGSLRWRWVGDDCIPRLPNIVAYKLVSEFRQEICGLEA